MIWFSSDNHYFHKNIILYSHRPYTNVEEMNEALIKNWNAIVKPNDEIWNLGDFSFGTYEETKSVLRKLNGTHNLILGNHDQTIIKNTDDLLKQKLFNSIQHYKELKYNNQHFVLMHYGMRVWNKSHHGSIMLYGHSHGTLPPFGKSVDVGVDCKEITDEYRPISIEEIIKYMDKKEIGKADRHGM